MEIELTDEPTVLVAAVRDRVAMTGLAQFYDSGYRGVAAAVARAGGRLVGPAIGWYHGMPTDTIDVAAAFPVDGLADGADLGDGVRVTSLTGGAAVVATFVGPYDGLTGAWREVWEWSADHAGPGRGDSWEVYVTEPSPDGDPAQNVTRLVLPVAGA